MYHAAVCDIAGLRKQDFLLAKNGLTLIDPGNPYAGQLTEPEKTW